MVVFTFPNLVSRDLNWQPSGKKEKMQCSVESACAAQPWEYSDIYIYIYIWMTTMKVVL